MTKKDFRKFLTSKNVKISRSDLDVAYDKHILRKKNAAKFAKQTNKWTNILIRNSGDLYDKIATNNRIKRWSDPINVSERSEHGEIYSQSAGRYSSRCTYIKYDHRPQVYSCGIPFGKWLLFRYGDKQYKLKAPNGWLWKKDQYGILIQRTDGAEYHPFMDDLLRENAIKFCTGEARRLFQIKKDQDKRTRSKIVLVKKASKSGIYVCEKDSHRAGNCTAGTTLFIRKHGFSGHVLSKKLEKFKDQRVLRTIEIAIDRTVKEMESGVCLLSDHF